MVWDEVANLVPLKIKAGKLVGAVLYGGTADGSWYQALLEQGADVTGIWERMDLGVMRYNYAHNLSA